MKKKNKGNVYLVNMGETDTVDLKDKKYKKQILRYGSWLHDGAKDGIFEVTKEKAEELVKNFKNKVVENVPVLRGHHSQKEIDANPALIAGYINDLELDDNGVWATLETSDEIADKEIEEKYKNVSASIDESYEDHESGDLKGWVMRHLALTYEPYIKGLDPKFVALADEYDKGVIEVQLEEKEDKKEEEEKNKDEVKEKEDDEKEGEKDKGDEEEKQKRDKEEPNEKDENDEPKKEESEDKGDEEEELDGSEDSSGVTKLSEGEDPLADNSDTELSEAESRLKLAEDKLAKFKREGAKKSVKEMIQAGKILPVQKDVALSLLTSESTVDLAEGKSESVSKLFKSFIKKMQPQIDLSERGDQPKTKKVSESEEKSYFGYSQKEIRRLNKKYSNVWK